MSFSATHGETKTRLFKIWSGMKERCYWLNYPKYNIYGGRGTNGANASGEAFLEEKYILNYDISTNNSTLVARLRARDADKVIVPVGIGAVTVTTGTVTNDTLNIVLTGAYELPVKGVSYVVSFDEGLVQDRQRNPSAALNDTSRTINNPGVNAPFIRINKHRGVVSGEGDDLVTTQPHQVNVKIDSQTPGATITFTHSTDAEAAPTNYNRAQYTGNYPRTSTLSTTVHMPTSSVTTYSAPFPLGPSGNNNLSGFIYGIRAEATYDSVTETAYEVAARSVIEFFDVETADRSEGTWSNLTSAVPAGRRLQLWLRGGDQRSGDNLTPGFPLSWNQHDHIDLADNESAGARLMTRTESDQRWYWITWEITSFSRPAYFHFICGTTSTPDEVRFGPHEWTWSKNAWTFRQDAFPLRPGESLRFSVGTTTNSQPGGTYTFFSAPFRGSR